MNSKEFCYWLQGHYELNEDQHLTEEQSKNVLAHANLAIQHDLNVTSKTKDFCIMVKNTIEKNYFHLIQDEIIKVLNGIFFHVIDNSYDGDQELYNQLHNAYHNDPNTTPRC